MTTLESLLLKCKTMRTLGFNNLNNCIHCYAHIINICSSHIVASMIPKAKNCHSGSKSCAKSNPKSPANLDSESPADSYSMSPTDSDHTTCNDPDSGSDDGNSEDELVDSDVDSLCIPDKLELAECQTAKYSPKAQKWLDHIQTDPLGHARQLIQFLYASGQHKEAFQAHIKDGNEHSWFYGKGGQGNRSMAPIP